MPRDDLAPAPTAADRRVALWLLISCSMIFVMVVIGGITRLTESGLSITEWKPVSGIIPPLSDPEWQAEFDGYKRIPEYLEINRGMTLEEFKSIYWWEFIHRIWGRLIGVVFLVPFVWLLLRRDIRREMIPHMIALFVLGGLQGALGWYMVSSGLAERTDVSQYRLTAHLLLALAIFSYGLWLALTLLRRGAPADPSAARMRPHLWLTALFIALTLTFGGFVAGLNGGLVYNSFPLMGGQLIPSDAFQLPWSPFEDPVTAQFIHRWLAITSVVLAIGLWLRRGTLRGSSVKPIALLAAMAVVQAGLGIATLLLIVPIPLAAAHQAGAVVLWTLALWSLHVTQQGSPRP
ncbi:MAG TPA: COX15/CtaA family protein [Verrucomicrobiae bacterium]|nr:COX15/CtaA family protein [Verrucomicrobiae bacterium]